MLHDNSSFSIVSQREAIRLFLQMTVLSAIVFNVNIFKHNQWSFSTEIKNTTKDLHTPKVQTNPGKSSNKTIHCIQTRTCALFQPQHSRLEDVIGQSLETLRWWLMTGSLDTCQCYVPWQDEQDHCRRHRRTNELDPIALLGTKKNQIWSFHNHLKSKATQNNHGIKASLSFFIEVDN